MMRWKRARCNAARFALLFFWALGARARGGMKSMNDRAPLQRLLSRRNLIFLWNSPPFGSLEYSECNGIFQTRGRAPQKCDITDLPPVCTDLVGSLRTRSASRASPTLVSRITIYDGRG